MHSSLSLAVRSAAELLSRFAASDTFADRWDALFGTSYRSAAAVDLRQQWLAGDRRSWPELRVLGSAALAGANAVYASSTDTIYLSASFLATASQASLVRVLLEEIGHSVDTRINSSDTPGDEGELFAHQVLGHSLSRAELGRLAAEDDRATLLIDGRPLLVEKAEPIILTVTTVLDDRDGSATLGSGLSLRDAILIANQNPATDYQIRLPGALVYNLRASGFHEDNALRGDLDIKTRTGSLAVVATGDAQATINASNLSIGDRIFHVQENGRLSLQNLILTGGNSADDGGAIRVERGGELLLEDADITANSTTGDGGGLANFGTAVIDRVRIAANRSTGSQSAAGCFNRGDLMLRNSSVSNNQGCGIVNFETLLMINATISGNSERGLYLSFSGTSAGLVNTTISGNQGGIYCEDSSLMLTNCTITNNFSDLPAIPGGIENRRNENRNGSVILKNTIVAGNINTRGGLADLNGEFDGDNNNLIGSLQGVVGSAGTGTDRVSATPGLAPLEDNGGLVRTHALLLNSPAINAGNDQLLAVDDEDLDQDGDTLEFIPFDARGPGFARERWGVVDIGAFESALQPTGLPVITLSRSPAAVAEDEAASIVFTFSRTGSTVESQLVQFTVGGTANQGSDYSALTPAGAIKSVTIAAGSQTATLAIRPIVDTTKEANESVSLRLSPSSLYRIGTTAAVSATILNDDFQGTSARDMIIGSAFADNIDGLAAGDVLTGLAGADRFRFRFSQSTLADPDRITDFTIAADKIKPLTAAGASLALPLATRAQDNGTATTLAQLGASVFADANGALAGAQPLAANRAALVVATNPAIAGTYVLINDATAALNASSDTLINITGWQGVLPAFGSFTSALLFA
jgi:hypothetical protein